MPLESTTYPHPHVDPRQPRDQSTVHVNPPVFAWKPNGGRHKSSFQLVVATDEALTSRVIDEHDLPEPLFLPERILDPGQYFWGWSDGESASDIHSFTIDPQAGRIEVPPAREWIKAFSVEHPRLQFSNKPVNKLRELVEKRDPGSYRTLFASAEELLKEEHHMDEPPYKGRREDDYEKYRKLQYSIMWGSRKFINGAQTMALAYVLGGKREFGEAAAKRMVSVSKWDPYGSTHLEANDEPHMSVMWYGVEAADWAWDCFTEAEKEAVIEQMRARAGITFEHMHDLGQYGIDRFDSHAGREIIFLANLLLAFHEHIPEAETWLNWLRPVLCGIWPIWADDDGSWAEGISYSLAYVKTMTLFASALKRRTGVDLYRKPFWINYARWRQACLPPYAEWMGFGDHSERWPSGWLNGARIIQLISREVGTEEFDPYIEQLTHEVESMGAEPAERKLVSLHPPHFLSPSVRGDRQSAGETPTGCTLRAFHGAGWAAFRTSYTDAESDVALIFRSSPYGSISHSHANNNDFILHAGGKVLAMPSGYYAGYASPHHAHWLWHTKSHNCVTLSGAPQLMRSPDSRGELLSPTEDEDIAYVLGNADESYADRARRCRRHVLFFKKENVFLLLDDFLPRDDVVSSFQWNLHSWARFNVQESERTFSLSRGGCSLNGAILYHKDGFFSMSEGWDPPFKTGIQNSDQWVNQYHLRFTPTSLVAPVMHCIPSIRFGVLLAPDTPKIPAPAIHARIEDGLEVAEFGSTRIEIPQPDASRDPGSGIARIQIGDKHVRLALSGIERM